MKKTIEEWEMFTFKLGKWNRTVYMTFGIRISKPWRKVWKKDE